LTEFQIDVTGPPGHADALLKNLRGIANRHGFTVTAPTSETGALGAVDTIIAAVGASTPVALLVWEIVKHKQNAAKANPEGRELKIVIRRCECSFESPCCGRALEVIDDSPETIAALERLHEDRDAGARPESA
jgi:hypothetical protein